LLYLIVTTQNNKSGVFNRFIESLNNQSEIIKNKLEVIILNQDSETINSTNYLFNYKIKNISKCSLSHARNIGIKLISDESYLIGFPDDDCWYNETVLEYVFEQLDKEIDYICLGVYDPLRKLTYGRKRPLNYQCSLTFNNIMTLSTSVGIFIKKQNNDILEFDENFSAGTRWGCGEETDLLLRMLSMGKKGIYNSFDSVYHEVENVKFNDIDRAYKYGLGFGAIIAKAVYKYKQNILIRIYNKIKIKTLIATIIFYFQKNKYAMYLARLKGIKDGYYEGKEIFRYKS